MASRTDGRYINGNVSVEEFTMYGEPPAQSIYSTIEALKICYRRTLL